MSHESAQSTDPSSMATGGQEEATASSSNVLSKDDSVAHTSHEAGYESECSTSSRSEADIVYSTLEIEADAYTRFIERQRMDVMFELRRIRLGERPVTGQANRERIETFINTIQESQQPPARVPSSRAPVPSAHMADINTLTSRRCVSAALTSAAFRQDLENTIRRSIGTRTPAASPIPTPVARASPPPAPPLPPTTRETSNSTIRETNTSVVIPAPSPPPATPVLPVLPVQQESRPAILNVERQERELITWQNITQLQRETIVLEISDLVHRQLVTSALESDFRRHLERNVLYRLEQGAQIQMIDGVPAAPHFPPAPPALVVPTPAINTVHPPAPPTSSTASHTRLTTATVDELSTRLDTMQQMLQLMFNMQIDMQRAIRQEVASALTNNRTGTNTNSATSIPLANHPVDAGQCTICLTAVADTVLYRCGHLCVCYTCGLHLQQARRVEIVKCPVCRAPVDDILRVYRSSRDAD